MENFTPPLCLGGQAQFLEKVEKADPPRGGGVGGWVGGGVGRGAEGPPEKFYGPLQNMVKMKK